MPSFHSSLGNKHKPGDQFQVGITTTKKNKAAGVVKGDVSASSSSSPGLRFRKGWPTGEEREGRGKGREKVVCRVGRGEAVGSQHGQRQPALVSQALSRARSCCFPGAHLGVIPSASWLLSRGPPALSL